MNTFNPDNNHCPQSCLCPMCKNNDNCEEACKEYKQMAHGCNECTLCRDVKK